MVNPSRWNTLRASRVLRGSTGEVGVRGGGGWGGGGEGGEGGEAPFREMGEDRTWSPRAAFPTPAELTHILVVGDPARSRHW